MKKRETILAQAGTEAKTTGHVSPGIATSSTYARDESLRLLVGVDYGRDGSPQFLPVEQTLTALEGGAASMVFASGMAAATAVFLALGPKDRVVVSTAMYWALRKWIVRFGAEWGLDVVLVDAWDEEALERAVNGGPTKLVWIETPANPTWEVVDIAAAARIAHAAGAKLAVDSTSASPVLTRPIEHGADIVMHSASKYLNGHSDVIAGTLTARAEDAHWARIRAHRAAAGGILGPFEAWLLLRGMRTLAVRVERASRTALELAAFLEAHPRVERVRYPGLASHPGHAIAARQMQGGFGGMLSIDVRGGAEAARAVVSKTNVVVRATSLGGTETLVEHRASAEGEGSIAPPGLLRISVGLEHVDDLRADLAAALDDPSK